MRLRSVVVLVALVMLTIIAFAAGTLAYQAAHRNDRARVLELYGSVLRIAGRSPLTLPSGSLAKQTDLGPVETFAEVERRLRAHYFEKIEDSTALAFGTADNMLDSLNDPYSRFLEPDQLKSYLERQQGIYSGIGAVLASRKRPDRTPEAEDGSGERTPPVVEEDRSAMPQFDDPVDINAFRHEVFISAIIPGGGAEAAGLRAGDVIRKVDGKLVFARNLDSLDHLLLAPDKGEVKLAVVRSGVAKPIEATVPLRVTRVQPVSARTSDGVGIITLRTMGSGVADAVRARVREMVAARVEGIVLDLRHNGDGDFDEASKVASTFISDGLVAMYKEQGGRMRDVPAESNRAVANVGRLVVLADETTSGPAELVAAAVKTRGAGKLIGGTTLGRASRQQLVRTQGNSAVLVTTSLFFSPLPKAAGLVEEKGVAPDVAVAAGQGGQDVALQQAIAWVKNGAA